MDVSLTLRVLPSKHCVYVCFRYVHIYLFLCVISVGVSNPISGIRPRVSVIRGRLQQSMIMIEGDRFARGGNCGCGSRGYHGRTGSYIKIKKAALGVPART